MNLGCVDPIPCLRTSDLEHPDELRFFFDPQPDASWDDLRQVALVARGVLDDNALNFPKPRVHGVSTLTCESSRRWKFDDVRRAAVAWRGKWSGAHPNLSTTSWWKEERHGVFVDYNQNARDRTVASASWIRPRPDARVSTPLTWDKVPTVDPAAFTIHTVPERLARLGDPAAEIDACPGKLDGLLEMAARDTANGLPDAPLPPHYPNGVDEPVRAQPSRRRKS